MLDLERSIEDSLKAQRAMVNLEFIVKNGKKVIYDYRTYLRRFDRPKHKHLKQQMVKRLTRIIP